MLAMIEAARPTTSPSASTMCHFFSTVWGVATLVVFMSAFMGLDLLVSIVPNERRRPVEERR
jgi:hypothetical protein